MSQRIYLVTQHSPDSGKPERRFLVRAHTRNVAEKHVAKKLRNFVEAKVASQDELLDAIRDNVAVESAYEQPAAGAREGADSE